MINDFAEDWGDQCVDEEGEDSYTDEYTDEEQEEQSSGDELETAVKKTPETSQKRRKCPSKCPVPRKRKNKTKTTKTTNKTGVGLKDELPKQIVRRRPAAANVSTGTSKPKSDRKCPTFDDSKNEDETASVNADEKPKTAEFLVEKMNALGKKFCRAKNVQQKMLMVSKISKADLNMFGVVIKNVWEGNHGAFQLAEEEHRRLRPHKLLFKEYVRKRTTFKRKREILLEGNILKNLTELMTQLEVE